MSPRISVLLPVYNCERYIKETIESVLNQTFSDFELLIIDDCSTDSTVRIVESFKDKRIQLFKKEKNTGYTNSLNSAILLAKGEYIARMDGDDICLPQRFEKQVKFLDNNREIILCGSAIQIIGTNSILKHPCKHEEIKVKLCFSPAIYHPTVMGRREVFNMNLYDKSFEPAEDYDLWTKLVFQGQLANLDEVLLFYRVHDNQISNTRKEIQQHAANSCRQRMLKKLYLESQFSEVKINKILSGFTPKTIEDCKIGIEFFNFIKVSNKEEYKIYDVELFDKKIDSVKISFLRKYFTKQEFFKINSIYFFLSMLTIQDFFRILRSVFKSTLKVNIA